MKTNSWLGPNVYALLSLRSSSEFSLRLSRSVVGLVLINILYDRAAKFLYYRAGTGALHAACVPAIENLPQTCVCARICVYACALHCRVYFKN